MNLVIFTPAIKTSAIGRMASLVTRSLIALGHQVTVVRTEAERLLDTEFHNFETTILSWNDFENLGPVLENSDSLIYQVGNNYEFHNGAIHWLSLRQGIVCLHDFFLGHLFWAWAETRRQAADAVLRAYYSEEVARNFFNFSNSEDFIDGTLNTAPLTEWICSMALGVITHSNWGCKRILDSCPGPIRIVPLAYNAPGLESIKSRITETGRKPLHLLTLGHVNSNKRIESVISAIGSNRLLKQQVVYHLIGKVDHSTKISLSTLAKTLGVKLIIAGEVDDTALIEAIAETDVIISLRWPTLEAASASAIEAMLYGKPIVVTDAGFCAEIPSSFVLKISPENETKDIESVLQRLINDSNLGPTIGFKAQKWASRTFTPENYANNLIEMAKDVSRSKPAIDAINYFCGLMHQWSKGNTQLILEKLPPHLEIF